MSIASPPSVAGTNLSGPDPYVISPEENRQVCRLAGVTPEEDGKAHPIFFFVATQVGMGMTVAGLCQTCEFDVDDGPMIASSSVVFQRPLMVGTPYIVTGEIVSLVRKSSRRFGVIDLLEYELRLTSMDSMPVLATRNVWVLPRRAQA